ncbi:acyl-CoA dehydrogenase [Rhodococcus opacus]|nr:acyl-CoA dehydrogenase [Rhodococcus opacus]
MTWNFETDPDYQVKLDWADQFVRTEIEPLDLVLGDPYDKSDERAMRTVRPLQQTVREAGLWACHLRPELGGQGYGQVKLALLNEILGRSRWAPSVFGCQAPDSGNAEILAKYGTEEQRDRYLQPLLDGEISSCYSMTEPQAGSDPGLFTTRAVRDGDEWVINGEKWFSSNARYSSFFIVMAVTDPELGTRGGMSMFIVPAETPGLITVRNVGIGTEGDDTATHGYLRYDNVRVPADHLLGAEGDAFAISQARLGGGRIHHAMRTMGRVRQTFDAMLERAASRQMRNGTLGSKQIIQEKIAESWLQMEQFRLLLLRTAWLIDKHHDYDMVRKDIAAVKAAMPQVLSDVVRRTLHMHGSLGVSNEMPFVSLLINAEVMGLVDGPTEVHQLTLAKQLLAEVTPKDGLWPTEHLPTRRAAAEKYLAGRVDLEAATL